MTPKAEQAELAAYLKEVWHDYAASSDCVVCGCDHIKFYIEGHHIVYRQHFEKKPDITLELVWDLRNCLPLCRLCHARHHNAKRKVLWSEIRRAAPKAWQFSAEVGLGWYIARYYERDRNAEEHVQRSKDGPPGAVSGLAHPEGRGVRQPA